MEQHYGSLKTNFDEMQEVIKNPSSYKDWRYDILVGMSIYHKHLSTLWEISPKNRFQFYCIDDLKQDAAGVCKKLFSFCNVDDTFSPEVSKLYNVTSENSISFIFPF